MDDSFADGLIKGRIAETIFSLMFEEAKEFDVLPLGYEQTTPILAQYQHLLHVRKVLDNIRNAPDFALISHDNKSLYLVEVKYRKSLINSEIIKIAQEMKSKFDPSWLFLATQNGLYFDSCNNILKNKIINQFSWINKTTQDKYLNLLRKFIRPE